MQTKSVNLESKHTDVQAGRIARNLTTPEIFTIYHIKGVQSRTNTPPTLAELKKELKSHGHDEKEYTNIKNSFEQKLIIEVAADQNTLTFTASGEHILRKLGELSVHHRK